MAISTWKSTYVGACVHIQVVLFVGDAIPENVQSVQSSHHHILCWPSHYPLCSRRWSCWNTEHNIYCKGFVALIATVNWTWPVPIPCLEYKFWLQKHHDTRGLLIRTWINSLFMTVDNKTINSLEYLPRLNMLLASAPFKEWSLLSSRPTSRAHNRSLCQGDPIGREAGLGMHLTWRCMSKSVPHFHAQFTQYINVFTT